jgi:hypothetical protein
VPDIQNIAFAILERRSQCYNIPFPSTSRKMSSSPSTMPIAQSSVKIPLKRGSGLAPEATSGGAYYIDANGTSAHTPKALDTSTSQPTAGMPTILTGIHARGCGETSGKRDTDLHIRQSAWQPTQAAGHSLTLQKPTPSTPSKTASSTRWALELSFEGYRFPELLERVSLPQDAGWQ